MKKQKSSQIKRFNYLKSIYLGGCLLCFSGNVSANFIGSYSDEIDFTIKMENKSVRDVFSYIEKNSEFIFIYQGTKIDLNRKVSIDIHDQPVQKILHEVFAGTNDTYSVIGRQIIVKKANTKNEAEVQILNQQKITVTGILTDTNGVPIIGANIVEKGTTNGTVTDLDGRFSLETTSNAILQISYIGYLTQEISLKGQSVVNVKLVEDNQALDEVVVVGYGTQKKANLTGAVSSVALDDTPVLAYNNSSSMLAGKVPGVFVTQNSGQPGKNTATVRIRGVGTMNNSDPLVLIDGMEGDINAVDPKDIENISVLKDASSAAIYGNRAANGVILVTTKRGKKNEKITLSYNGSVGFQKATRIPETFDTYEHVLLYNEALENCGLAKMFTDEDVQKFKEGTEDGYKNTNWGDLFYGGAKPVTTHNLSMKGGGDRITSFLSLGYMYQEGVRYKQSFDRINIRSNTQAYFLEDDKLQVQFLLDFTRGKRDDGLNKYSSGSALDDAAPYMQLKYDDPADPSKQVYGSYSGLYFAAIDQGAYYKETNYDMNGKALLSYEVIKNLNLKFEFGAKYKLVDFDSFLPSVKGYYYWSNVFHSWGASSVERSYANNLHTTINAFADYEFNIADSHHFKILAGYSQEESVYKKFNAKRSNLISNSFPELVMGDVETSTNGSDAWEYALRSGFARLNYDYKDKYLLEANVRYDGSSRFAKGNRWGLFPSFSAAWRITEEGFMEDVNKLDNLKLRASWGKLGNQNVSNYAAADLISMGSNAILNNTLIQGASLTYLADKNISWETITQANVGVDVGFLNKFNAQLDVYTKTASDILRQLPVPATTGVSNPAWRNVAKVRNTGFDFNIQYATNIGKDWSLSANLGLSHFKNEVLDMGEIGTQYSGVSIITEGEPFMAYYGLEVGGLVRSEDELKKIPQQIIKTEVGDLWYKDQDGDGKVTTMDDRVVIGNPYPDLSYSLHLDLRWRDFSLSTLLQGEQGVDAYCSGAVFEPFTWGYTTGTWWRDRWTPENPNASMHRLWVNKLKSQTSDFFVQNASYLRMKSLSLSYNVPKHIISRIGIQNMMLYGSAHNLLTITKFKGYDPERPIAGSGFNTYPQVKSYTIGVQIDF